MAMPQRDNYIEQIRWLEGLIAERTSVRRQREHGSPGILNTRTRKKRR